MAIEDGTMCEIEVLVNEPHREFWLVFDHGTEAVALAYESKYCVDAFENANGYEFDVIQVHCANDGEFVEFIESVYQIGD